MVTFFMNSLYPVMLGQVKEGEEKLKNLIKKLTFLLLFTSLPLTLLVFFLAPLLTLIKADFSPSILALRVLSFSFPLFFLSALFMWVLIALGRQRLLMFFYGISMILNIILNLIFIPQYGYLASATLTGVTELAVLILTGLCVFYLLKKPSLTNRKIS